MINKLTINNDFCKLELENNTIIKMLWQSLRFRPKDCFHNPAYKLFRQTGGKRGWDGYVEFFNQENGKFATGLLFDVINQLSKLSVKLEIEDNRTQKIKTKEIDENSLSKYKNKFNEKIILRDYQCELANKAWKYERGIIKAATAAGKTILFTAMVKSMEENPKTLILFRNKTLVNQTYKEFLKYGIKNVGIVHGDLFDVQQITCATIQSIHKIEEILPEIEVLIVDECHEFSTNNTIRIFKKMKNCRYRFGFSATPWSQNDKVQKYRVKSWFGPVLGNIETKDLQEQNILSESICYFHTINKPYDIFMNNYEMSYQKGVVENTHMHEKIKEIVDSYTKGRILIIVEKIEHGNILKEYFPNAYWINGSDDDKTRENVIEKLTKSNDNEKNVAIATKIFQTGVDIHIHALINAAGYKSDIMTIQRLGRGLRKAPDKKHLDYHDFMFSNNDYLENHSKERIKWLKKEGHKIKILDE